MFLPLGCAAQSGKYCGNPESRIFQICYFLGCQVIWINATVETECVTEKLPLCARRSSWRAADILLESQV